jgi:hypothetical protein
MPQRLIKAQVQILADITPEAVTEFIAKFFGAARKQAVEEGAKIPEFWVRAWDTETGRKGNERAIMSKHFQERIHGS